MQNINRYQGEFYFSVNIPPCIAYHDNLARMMETARNSYRTPIGPTGWCWNLLKPSIYSSKEKRWRI